MIRPWPLVFGLILFVGCGSSDRGAADAGRIIDDLGTGADAEPGDVDAKDGATRAPDPNDPNNARKDSDCDGLSDAEEFGTIWASGTKSDPGDADSDGDGLPDGLEAGRTASVDPSCTVRPDEDPSSRTDPTHPDGDGDGLGDGDEDANQNGAFERSSETDPRNPDSDGDGLCDGPATVNGVCTGGDPSPIPGGQDGDRDGVIDPFDPSPMNADTDGDGLCDGSADVLGVCTSGEDLDGDGARGPGESDPERIDTDCDGLVDGAGYGGFRGERDLGSDPTEADTDGDGLRDGVEAGVTAAPDPTCAGFVPDADPGSTTDPTRTDTDGDTLPDGAEDTNQDGERDPGELDPEDGTDGTSDPTAIGACAVGSLIPIDRRTAFAPDQQIATRDLPPDAYLETSTVESSTRTIGLMGYNATVAVSYLALSRRTAAADVIAEEQSIRAILGRVGALATPITTATVTWDGYPAVYASYDMAGRAGVKARANEIVLALAPGATGLLPTANDVDANGFKVRAEVVRRSAQTSVVLVALAPASRTAERTAFALSDLAGGSALAQFGDGVGVQCDRFSTAAASDLDILWAVDNSISMADEQAAVAAAARAMADRLDNAPVSWRAAVVASGFYQPGAGAGCTNRVCSDATVSQCRTFTADTSRFARWFTQGQPAWIGAGGPCNQPREEIIRGAELLLSQTSTVLPSFMPPQPAPSDEMHLRSGAHLLLVLMGDADDQYYANNQLPTGIDRYEAFFRTLPMASLNMGGILCPEGEDCGETQRTPRVARALINRFGGVIGSLRELQSIGPTMNAIVDATISAISPYRLTKDAIASTIKVVMENGSTIGVCNTADVRRSRIDGFDYEARTRSIQLFGACRPARTGARVSVSYRYYIDQTGEPDRPQCMDCGTCSGISRCDLARCACVCDQPLDCGSGYRWDPSRCDCVCDAQSLACPLTHLPDLAACACVCAPDCGGCAATTTCQPSLCVCEGGI
jgi:hypothetical protein